MTVGETISKIPHETRQLILLDWLPNAIANLSNESFRLLWEAYFIYVDPDAVRMENCQSCKDNVLKNWKYLSKGIEAIEKEYNLLEKI